MDNLKLNMKRTIIVVNEDEPTRERLASVLCQDGYDVVTAATCDQALLDIAGRRPALFVLEQRLSLKHGWETFGDLTRFHPDVPIILTSPQADKYPAALMSGVDACMEAPVDPDELLRHASDLLATPVSAGETSPGLRPAASVA